MNVKELMRKVTFFGGMIVFILSGCQYQKLPTDPIVVSNIETEFSVRMYEQLGGSNRQLVFHISSIQLADCLNGGISYDLLTNDDGINVTIKKVIEPGNCIEGIAPYQTDIYLGSLTETGTTNIALNLQDVVENHGFLIVNENQYELKLNSSHGLTIPNVVLHKIPESFVWGYVAINHSNQKAISESFIQSLTNRGYALGLKEGDYGYFYVLASGQLIRLETQMENPVAILPISFGYVGDWNELTNEVETFRQEHPDIDVRLFNNQGFVY